MKKTFVAVFAHPDDEAFGPSGTLIKMAQEYDLYILCATRGEAGQNHHEDQESQLSDLREKELLESAKIIGAKGVHFLDFVDGTLCNNMYHDLADKIKQYLEKYKPEKIMTFEFRGISGHIDHITVALAATYAVQKLPFVKEILYHCIPKQLERKKGEYFIFMPPGYDEKDVDLVVDIEDVWDQKVRAMRAHKSQKKDAEGILQRAEGKPKRELFFVYENK
jgi:LmbE family N-acetylglucosaminyl deacetylase